MGGYIIIHIGNMMRICIWHLFNSSSDSNLGSENKMGLPPDRTVTFQMQQTCSTSIILGESVTKYSTKVDGQGPQNPLTLQGTHRPKTPTNQPTSHLSKPFPWLSKTMSRVSTRSQVITSATAQSEFSWPKRWRANSEFHSPANLVASGYTKSATKPLLFFKQSVGGISWHPVSDHKKYLSVTLIMANQPTPP